MSGLRGTRRRSWAQRGRGPDSNREQTPGSLCSPRCWRAAGTVPTGSPGGTRDTVRASDAGEVTLTTAALQTDGQRERDTPPVLLLTHLSPRHQSRRPSPPARLRGSLLLAGASAQTCSPASFSSCSAPTPDKTNKQTKANNRNPNPAAPLCSRTLCLKQPPWGVRGRRPLLPSAQTSLPPRADVHVPPEGPQGHPKP